MSRALKLKRFLKRWRQAYLEDKGNRLHAQVQAERDAQIEEERIWNALTPGEKADIARKIETYRWFCRSVSKTAEDAMLKRGFFS